ncbi:hypothetical protein [Paraferrimonas sp. SM1919]|uniref:hypothetical protein n=1 Tax=Paraferrimonas sp. SM1919 TaxID=2662263 RepID=UPI0013D5DD86|nr:hypothetical protein [Paraferrimonas sp. SM1919]
MGSFTVNLSELDRPRKPGISGIMRIKNGEDFLALTIEKHLPYYDEIIACYNDCSDNTVTILKRLQHKYPNKVKVFHYEPKVYPLFSEEHASADMSDIHSMANYYNYALSQANYCVATKLDDDHYPVEETLASLINTVRKDIAEGKQKLYTFSGINVADDDNKTIGIPMHAPIVGTGDHMYFPVCSNIYFEQGPEFEHFVFKGRKLEKKYYGLAYIHLKFLKKDLGYLNLPMEKQLAFKQMFMDAGGLARFDRQGMQKVLEHLKGAHCRAELFLYDLLCFKKLLYLLFKKNPPLRIERIQRFESDFNSLDIKALLEDMRAG